MILLSAARRINTLGSTVAYIEVNLCKVSIQVLHLMTNRLQKYLHQKPCLHNRDKRKFCGRRHTINIIIKIN